jgi:hypothetical protein
MKTVRTSDETRRKLTGTVGTLMAQTGKMKTYSDAVETILDRSVMLSPELLEQVESFIKDNLQLSYATREGFIQDAIRLGLTCCSEDDHTTESH